MFILNQRLYFPPIESATEEGILAIGGDLSTERLILAYKNGIFPWYNDDQPVIWWSPDPRFVLFPDKLKVSKSMQKVLQSNKFSFSINKAFSKVIRECRIINRKNQDGTWITNEIEQAYTQLHLSGLAHSAETWFDGELIGGLYGVKIGNIFFGESMFSKLPNASKFAFINFVDYLKTQQIVLIDCQLHSKHLESLGAEMIARNDFKSQLLKHCK